MTSKQIKTKIQKALEEIPESVLEEVLKYINGVKGKSKTTVEMSRNLSKIFEEDQNGILIKQDSIPMI